MKYEDYRGLIEELPFGKKLRNAQYLHLDFLVQCAPRLQGLVEAIRDRTDTDRACNVIKFHLFEPKISLFAYPVFLFFSAPSRAASCHHR